jgi:hypothetical protein
MLRKGGVKVGALEDTDTPNAIKLEERVRSRRTFLIFAIMALLLLPIAMIYWKGNGLIPSRNQVKQDFKIAATDQASRKIVVFDPADPDWNDEGAVKWSWSPSASNGFSGLTWGWGLPSGVKLRNNSISGGQSLVVTDSKGLAAIVPYPEGDSKQWGLVVGGDPHEAELLPNGNIAIAASAGGWVRLYTSSQGPTSSTYVEYPLSGAHGVLWDPDLKVLWALGDYLLVALKVGGTDSSPSLEEVILKKLPTPLGHDLQPVYGNSDRLWVSTGSKVYQYVKSSGTWDPVFPGHMNISRPRVKSIGNQPSGQVVSTVPKKGCRSDWCTDTVDFFEYAMTRTRTDAAFYKARIMNPDYQ